MTETPEAILDSIRGLLNWYAGDKKTVGSLRYHLKYDDEAVVPPGFDDLPDTDHVNKSLFADILYRTFKAAEERELEQFRREAADDESEWTSRSTLFRP